MVNNLLTEGMTIHWHGLFLHNTPWMDGVAHITQCPITPGNTFTYRFLAAPTGSHWYHAHNHNQRLDGLFGQLLVHRTAPVLVYFPVTVIDWWHPDSITAWIASPYATYKGSGEFTNYVDDRRFSFDNNEEGSMLYYSTLVGGRGRFVAEETLPLQVYHVTSGKRFRFHLTHTGAELAYEVSIDNHTLEVVACDGADITPITVNAFIIFPGERVDFILLADKTANRYWLRMRTMGYGTGESPTADEVKQEGLAIIEYEGVVDIEKDPSSLYMTCQLDKQCVIFNCPFARYPGNWHKRCIGIQKARSTMGKSEIKKLYGLQATEIEEMFFNFNMASGSNINGWKFKLPKFPLYQDDSQQSLTTCKTNNSCKCTQIQNIPENRIIQMVLISYNLGAHEMAHHSVHLHGYNFAVLASGYPPSNIATGAWTEHNENILCDNSNCFNPGWNGTQPLLNLDNPPIKDTVVIPARGYVIIRFRSDNPGFWLFHCHQAPHAEEGMTMVIKVGDYNDMPALPPFFPTCHDFEWTSQEFDAYFPFKWETTSPAEIV